MISRNSYYQWVRNSNRIKRNKTTILKSKIIQIWQENRKVYGSYKITKILAREGVLLPSFIYFKTYETDGNKESYQKKDN